MNLEGFFFVKFSNFKLNVTFNFSNSNIITILGQSGSGKSTFLKCISGIIKPQISFFKINNSIIQDSLNNYFLSTNKRFIGHALQGTVLLEHLSFFENINILKFNIKKMDEFLDIFFLRKSINKKIIDLSGGEKQRLQLLQIFLSKPKLILLDESFSFQDNYIKENLLKFYKKINKINKIPIIYVSHNINDAEFFSDNIFYMNNGKLFF